MAISAAMVWETRSGGSDSNGGGFRGGAAVSTPSAPSVSATTGGSVAVGTYYVVVTIVDGNGETSKSAETSVTTSSGNQTITVTAPTNPNVTGATWNVYVATASGGPYWQQSTGNAFGVNKAITSTPPTSGTQAPGTDYSQQNSPQVTVDNSAITATTAGANSNVITFTGYTPTAADIGNVYHSTGGTNINTGWFEVIAWTSTTWTVTGASNLTTAGGAGSALLGKMGGALASPGGLGAVGAAGGTTGNLCFIKYNATAYSCGSTANAAAGRYNGGFSGGVAIVGYDTTRTRDNTDANLPILDAGAASMTVFTVSGANSLTRNLSVTNSAARASVTGFSVGIQTQRCKADSCATGFSLSGVGVTLDCYANACGNAFLTSTSACWFERCVSVGHTTAGFSTNANNVYLVNCVAKGGTATGFLTVGGFAVYHGCISRDNSGGTSYGFSSSGHIECINCIAYNNGGANYNGNTSSTSTIYFTRIWNCAGGTGTNFSTSTSATTGIHGAHVHNFVTLTGDPHTNASAGDLSLNNTAGAGAACKAAGLPGSTAATQLFGLSTSAYPDIGPVQSQATAGPSYFAY